MQEGENKPGRTASDYLQTSADIFKRQRRRDLAARIAAYSLILLLSLAVVSTFRTTSHPPGPREAEQMLGSLKLPIRAYYDQAGKLPATLTEANVNPSELVGKYYTVEDKIIANADGSFTLHAVPVNNEDHRCSLRVPLEGGIGEFNWEE